MNNNNRIFQVGSRVKRVGTGVTGTVTDFGTDEGKLTYIVQYDKTQLRPSDGFEYQTEEVFAEEIELDAFFIAGKKYHGIKDVKMDGSRKIAFKAGKVYEQTDEPTYFVGWLRNEQNDRHAWPQPVYIPDTVKTWGSKPENIDPRLYFEPVKA